MRDFISSGLILILSSVSGLLLAPTEKKQEMVCRATSMGNPCAQGGVATLGRSTPGPDHGTGNPIDLRSGNKYQRETDLPMQASGLELVRHYNAMDPRVSALGRGWSWSYDTRIYVIGQQLQVIQADASRLVFECTQGRCVSKEKLRGEIRSLTSGWLWLWPTGKQLTFDAQGRLTRLYSKPDKDVLIQRHPETSKLFGEIDWVQAEDQQLKFNYHLQAHRPKLLAVQTPQGTFHYLHDQPVEDMTLSKKNNRLFRVIRPDAMQRSYHYEPNLQAGNAYALTGISVGDNNSAQRTHSWRYDHAGRANLFISGPLDHRASNVTIPFNHTRPDLKIESDEKGVIRALDMNVTGWPGLKLRFNAEAEVSSWHMRGLGVENWSRGKSFRGKWIRRTFADQSAWQWQLDAQARVISMRTEQVGRPSVKTRIDWRANRPVVIEHPQETQLLRYASHTPHGSLMREREIFRPAIGNHRAWSYRERFRFNDAGQRSQHMLPEGGSVHYWWKGHRLLSIEWRDAQGRRYPIIDATAAGIRHGNGLITTAIKDRLGLTDLILYQPIIKSALFHQQLRYNARGVITAETIRSVGVREDWVYRRDPRNHLLPSAWPMDRRQVLRDVTGLPVRVGDKVLQYGAQRRLESVKSVSKLFSPVQYVYNATGERIWRADGTQQTQYLFDQNKLVAEAQVVGDAMQIVRRYIYAHHVPVAVIENGRDLYMIHTDAVGLPRLLTDTHQRVRWHGQFSPYGELKAEQGDQKMLLRLPGQLADPVTGFHENYQRTYEPRWGQYLEPDPLGPMPGNSLYGYAAQQPRRNADPLGLMLFAFDGTGNQPSSLTNVWLFSKAYRDGPVHYIAGPAGDVGMTPTDVKTDMAVGWSGSARVNQQWERLLNAFAQLRERNSKHNQIVPIDIIGFSRGAALARHFGNRVVEHVKEGRFSTYHPLHGLISSCVDLRFVGLFDTVAQFNVLGLGNAAFNLDIAPAWKWVSHAVALHEHRWLFPLTSAAGPANVVERAFVGAHADIGGGYLTAEASPGSTPGDLSQVALAWMQWQAEAAGVGLGRKAMAHTVRQPLVHDERAVFSRKAQNGDRRVNHADGRKWVNYQADLPRMGQGLRKEVEAFINRPPDLSALGSDVVGQVDMAGYMAWLKDSIGLSWQ